VPYNDVKAYQTRINHDITVEDNLRRLANTNRAIEKLYMVVPKMNAI
jgi:hypothetical protein